MHENIVMAGISMTDVWSWLANLFSANDLALVQAYLPQLLVAMVLGSLIGLERRYRAKQAGVRTYLILTTTACLVAITGYHLYEVTMTGDPARLAHGVLNGVGFVGAGVILRRGWNASGVTTSATILFSVGVGIACGLGLYSIAAITTVLSILAVSLSYKLFPNNDFGGNALRVVCPIENFKEVRKLFGTHFARKRFIWAGIDRWRRCRAMAPHRYSAHPSAWRAARPRPGSSPAPTAATARSDP